MYSMSCPNVRFSVHFEDDGQDAHEDMETKAVENMLSNDEDELLARIWMILLFISII